MVKSIKNNFIFEGIKLKKRQQKIVTLLSSCKEVRDTAYPLDNSNVTELVIKELYASKQKGYTYLSGRLQLEDGEKEENRNFVAYLTEKNNEYHILLDITRNINGENRMIRTTDIIQEEEENIISHTSYCSIGFLQEKEYCTKLQRASYDRCRIHSHNRKARPEQRS